MPTQLEKNMKAARRQSGVIVPLLNELFKAPLEIATETDAVFLHMLAMKQVAREQVRKSGDGVYSPSGLASCLRRVYLSKNWKQLGLERVELPAIEAHYYFTTGDFIHLKWQYAFYKLSIIMENFWLVDVEIPVVSKRKDHGGTIDVLCLLDGEPLIIDVKGLNVRAFHNIDDGSITGDYRIQLTDYMVLFNSALSHGLWVPPPSIVDLIGPDFPKVKRGFILAENKGGPDARHPTALTEYEISLKDNKPEVQARLEVLRTHEEEKTLPEIECTSRRTIQFQGCPFAGYCNKEVKAVEKRTAKDRDSAELKLAKPKRSNRPRRPKSG
jgi:hypothetical protein